MAPLPRSQAPQISSKWIIYQKVFKKINELSSYSILPSSPQNLHTYCANDYKSFPQLKNVRVLYLLPYIRSCISIYTIGAKVGPKSKLVKLKSLLSGSGDTKKKKTGRGCTVVAIRQNKESEEDEVLIFS